MTREEYDAKAENGTLSVGDVLDNPEFATAEQVAAIAAPGLLRECRKRGLPDTAVLRQLGQIFDGFNRVAEGLALADWQGLNTGKKAGPELNAPK